MFLRATRISAAPDRTDALVANFSQEVGPAARKIAGNRGAILLVDRTAGRGWGLTYWEDEAALKASEEAGTSLRSQAVKASGGTIQEVDRFETVIQERRAESASGVFCRVNDVAGDPAKIANAVALLGDKALPILEKQTGFRAFIVNVNRTTGRAIVSSVWDTMADLEASNAAVKDLRDEITRVSGASSVKVETYEVAFIDLQVGAATR